MTDAARTLADVLSRPYTYAYQYHDCIRFTGGIEHNGERPSKAIPIYTEEQVKELIAALRASTSSPVSWRSFDTTGTVLQRAGNFFTIICKDGDTANRVADQLRDDAILSLSPAVQTTDDEPETADEIERLRAQSWKYLQEIGVQTRSREAIIEDCIHVKVKLKGGFAGKSDEYLQAFQDGCHAFIDAIRALSPSVATPVAAVQTTEPVAWRDALENCLGCITAAESEGLHEVISELRGFSEQTDRLIDLVERRLLWVREYAAPILAAPVAAAPTPKTFNPLDVGFSLVDDGRICRDDDPDCRHPLCDCARYVNEQRASVPSSTHREGGK